MDAQAEEGQCTYKSRTALLLAGKPKFIKAISSDECNSACINDWDCDAADWNPKRIEGQKCRHSFYGPKGTKV